MYEKAKFVCLNYMQQPQVKFKSVQINMKHVSYSGVRSFKKRNIAATSLKIVCKNIYSVTCYDKTNMKGFFCINSLWKRSGA